ncbi:protein phosphatase CheZ [Tistrella mobilis]|uniref:Chemotaxis protein CheZ n=1 Tax=Tistrella mobilis (strain KA081020-065) TaxID=1110502 RepID=I3TJK5_TISMK|nr:protein phosphatase CheZ [Tistrella mobilis]AFK52943.1 chemotaxis protein CheZ [Tistrella mobilis KA081020-065]MAM72723.1 chemotaxis protein CheZ [Tistrella sp.]
MNVKGNLRADLQQRIDTLRAERGENVQLSEVTEVVEALLGTMDGDITAQELQLYGELNELATYIQRAKLEIAELSPHEIRTDHIPSATDELDAIVGATEVATSNILDAVETIENVLDGLEGEAADRMRDQVTRIYEACNFQDVTGQRIGKVVKTLKYIEIKIDAMISVFGDMGEAEKAPADPSHKTWKDVVSRVDDDQTLEGPASNDDAIRQEDIDALFD